MAEEVVRERAALTFKVYGQPLAMVSSFCYLRHTLTETDCNWTEFIGNLQQ